MLARRWLRRRLSVIAVALVVSVAGVAAVPPAGADPEPPGAMPPVPGRPHKVKPPREGPEDHPMRPAAKPEWPAAGAAEVNVPAAGKPGVAPSAVQAGKLPVYVSAPPPAALKAQPGNVPGEGEPGAKPGAQQLLQAPSRVRVQVLDQGLAGRAGASGLLVRVTRTDGAAKAGPVTLTLDYAGFKYAYGANFADRLQVAALPGCTLSSPGQARCGQQLPLKVTNDVRAGKIAAVVSAAPAAAGQAAVPASPEAAAKDAASSGVAGLVSVAAGQTGDFRATDARASGKWEVGLQSGAFTYSYPIEMPPAPYGKAPDLALTYNSQSVDGRTSGENTQASWAGMGWELAPGFIERKFKPCRDDAGDEDVLKTWGDLCWDSPFKDKDDGAVYVISLNGVTSELIWDGSHYRMKDDQDWKIVHHKDGGKGADKEYWVVTTTDGTRHTFGYGADPTKTDSKTNSVWTVPVIGDDAGEPCHNSSTPSQMKPCKQAYRWNIDQITDPNENSAVLWYTTEDNAWKRVEDSSLQKYVRGGYLNTIEYGLREDQPKDTPATNRVTLKAVNRCVERVKEDDPYTNPPDKCPTLADGGEASYKDVPLDLVCETSCSKKSPAFFVKRRLDKIDTWARQVDGSGYDKVSTFQARMKLPTTEDETSPSMWLDYMRKIGHMGDGDDVKMPVTNFNGTRLNNRATSGESMNMYRIDQIQNDLGGDTNVSYGHANKCNTDLDDWSGDKNKNDCFRQYYQPEGADDGKWGIFRKYVVTKVMEEDRVGGQPQQTTAYEYLYGAGWHFDDNLNAATKYQSWSDWRGYKTVKVTKGASADVAQRSVSTHSFFRGLHGDRTNRDNTAHREESLGDFTGGAARPDHFYLAGKSAQVRAWNGATDLTSTKSSWWNKNTADGPGLHNAQMVRPEETLTRSRKASGYRTTKTTSTFDSHGMPVTSLESGDAEVSGDERCTTTSYARNTDDWRWMIAYPQTVRLRHDTCGGTVAGQTITLYDGADTTSSNRPVDGNVTEAQTYFDEGNFTYTRHTYDTYGRPTSTTAPNGTDTPDDDQTFTTYNPPTGWPHKGIQQTDPQKRASYTIPSRRDGATVETTDHNSQVSHLDYDRAGRLVRAWAPPDHKPTDPATGIPAAKFTYKTPYEGVTPPTGQTIVKSESLISVTEARSDYSTSYAYLDGFGRIIETQSRSPQGSETGRLITASRYDDRGQLAASNTLPIFDDRQPGTGLHNPNETTIPSWTKHTYDPLGRETNTALYSVGQKKWETTTSHSADLTVVTPPAGGKTATRTDAYGRTTSRAEDYDPLGSATIRYEYTLRGELEKLTDPAGNVTSYRYDWTGRRKKTTDPDAGQSLYGYSDAGNLVLTTDATGKKTSSAYDALNRRIAVFAGETNGTKLAAWSYDPQGAYGQLSAAVRYSGGKEYRTDILSYDKRYQPTGKRVTIPDSEGNLAGTYDYKYDYDRAGHITEMTVPAGGGLPAETIKAKYSQVTGTPRTLTSDHGDGYTYVKHTYHWSTGELAQRDYGKNGGINRQYRYNNATGQPDWIGTFIGADTETPKPLQDDIYTHDPNGNVTSIKDRLATGGTYPHQNQCFSYDGYNRLKTAFTTTEQHCTGGIGTADNKGPDPYKLAYTYTWDGNIQQVKDNDTTRTYDYPDPETNPAQPHAVRKITSSNPQDTTDTYAHNDLGQLTAKTAAGKKSEYQWDELNKLASVTTDAKKTSFLYDAGGSRLIRRDPDGTATLYLDGMEIRGPPGGGEAKATRYYTLNGATIALRKTGDEAATWLTSDTQGSAQVAIEGWTGKVSRQRYLPYGGHRGGRDDITATQKGFLGKTEDPSTSLVALDNRYYDPAIGRFINPDPVTVTGSTQQLNPYAYAGNNPTSDSDPSGLCPSGGGITSVKSGPDCVDGWTNVPSGGSSPGWISGGGYTGGGYGGGYAPPPAPPPPPPNRKAWGSTHTGTNASARCDGDNPACCPKEPNNDACSAPPSSKPNVYPPPPAAPPPVVPVPAIPPIPPLGAPLPGDQNPCEHGHQFDCGDFNPEPGADLDNGSCGDFCSKPVRPSWIDWGALPGAEVSALSDTLNHISAGTKPSDETKVKWGSKFKNWGKDLPGPVGPGSPYREYRVAPPPGTEGAGTLRVVRNVMTGEMYYTWTHYGKTGPPAFVRIR